MNPEMTQAVRTTGTPSSLKRGQNLSWLLMCLPALIVLGMFSYAPMAGVVIAFKNYRASDGIWGSAWVGFKNFEFLFNSGNAVRITWKDRRAHV